MAMIYIAPHNGSKIGYYYDADRVGTFNGYPYKGIVTAVMKNTRNDVWKKIQAIGHKVGLCFAHNVPVIEDSYHGNAYCSADDKFDLTEGMRVCGLHVSDCFIAIIRMLRQWLIIILR